jgi:hypothetical protein
MFVVWQIQILVRRGFPMNVMLTVAALAISVALVYAQGQSSAGKLKADAQNVVKIISGDKLKSQTYCEITHLNDQIDQAQDAKKAEELSQKADELEKKLGPEFAALADGLNNIDPTSQDGREISAIFEKLDELCGN